MQSRPGSPLGGHGQPGRDWLTTSLVPDEAGASRTPVWHDFAGQAFTDKESTLEQERDLTGAMAVYRSSGYPGARWYVMPDGDVVLQRPSGELDTTIMTPEALASASSRPASVWYLETSTECENSDPPAAQG